MYCQKTGFTLVELLAVIAIISILAALLLPTLQQAQVTALNVVCTSNLRQTGMAISNYANNNDMAFPVTWTYVDNNGLNNWSNGTITGAANQLFACDSWVQLLLLDEFRSSLTSNQYIIGMESRRSISSPLVCPIGLNGLLSLAGRSGLQIRTGWGCAFGSNYGSNQFWSGNLSPKEFKNPPDQNRVEKISAVNRASFPLLLDTGCNTIYDEGFVDMSNRHSRKSFYSDSNLWKPAFFPGFWHNSLNTNLPHIAGAGGSSNALAVDISVTSLDMGGVQHRIRNSFQGYNTDGDSYFTELNKHVDPNE